MRVLVTGSAGFAGRWLVRELAQAGHDVAVDRSVHERIDIRDRTSVGGLVARSRPHLVVHLAAVSFGPDAAADAATAVGVNVGGTAVLIDAIRTLTNPPALLMVSSSEVYDRGGIGGGAITEEGAALPSGIYGQTKLAQESIALASVARHGSRVAVVRPFNHTGPGQRVDFAVPAFAARILATRKTGARTIRAGNVDVRRDIGDVRDTVRAYRLVGEALVTGEIATGRVLNVATGVATRIGDIIERLAALAGIDVEVQVDPTLVRADDVPVVVGDAAMLRRDTGWEPSITLDQTLRDVLADIEDRGEPHVPPPAPSRGR